MALAAKSLRIAALACSKLPKLAERRPDAKAMRIRNKQAANKQAKKEEEKEKNEKEKSHKMSRTTSKLNRHCISMALNGAK